MLRVEHSVRKQNVGNALTVRLVLELLVVVGIEICYRSSVVTSCPGSSPLSREKKEERLIAWSASWNASAL